MWYTTIDTQGFIRSLRYAHNLHHLSVQTTINGAHFLNEEALEAMIRSGGQLSLLPRLETFHLEMEDEDDCIGSHLVSMIDSRWRQFGAAEDGICQERLTSFSFKTPGLTMSLSREEWDCLDSMYDEGMNMSWYGYSGRPGESDEAKQMKVWAELHKNEDDNEDDNDDDKDPSSEEEGVDGDEK